MFFKAPIVVLLVLFAGEIFARIFSNSKIIKSFYYFFQVAAQCESENLLPLVTGGQETARGEAPSVVSILKETIFD